jgi:hypothetical protein
MIGTLSVCMPNLSTRRKPSLAASTRTKERPHGALCEIVVEALQNNMIDFTDLYFDILQATALGAKANPFLSLYYLEAASRIAQSTDHR